MGLGTCVADSSARETETRGSLELTGQPALHSEGTPGSVGDLVSNEKISQDFDLLPHAFTFTHTDTDGQYIHRRIS